MVQISNNGSSLDGAGRLSRRAESRRLEILRAAAKVFRDKGFASTGMREIAAGAGLSPGNLYYYFKGKHEILFFCQDRSLDRMLDALDAARASAEPVAQQLHAVIRAHLRCMLDELEGSAAHLEVEALPPELREPIIAKRDRYERGVRGLIAGGMRLGDFEPGDADLITRAILGAVNWTARWFRSEGPRSATSVADTLSDYLVRGLRTGATRPAATANHA